MNNLTRLAAACVLACTLTPAGAGVVTQEFVSEWTVSTWDYYGDVAALRWHYLTYTPWNASLGVLDDVTISTAVSGTRDPAERLALRYAFFTGWDPVDYQLAASVGFEPGEAAFSATFALRSGNDFALERFASPRYLPQAHYYFESRTATTHQITARTTLTYLYRAPNEVPEPSGWLLLAAGAGACGAARALRRGPARARPLLFDSPTRKSMFPAIGQRRS
jgi:hypothetical protein